MKHLIETELGKRAERRPVRRGLVSAKGRRTLGSKSGVSACRKVSTKRRRGAAKAKTPRTAKPASVPAAPEAGAPVMFPLTESIIGRGTYDGNTAFNLYLREVAETPLLTPRDEVELAARIKRGDKSARERMIKANLQIGRAHV